MDRERSEAWVARVVAWHNRHLLARRITPAEVQGLGYVDLPFAAAEGALRKTWSAAFSEDFLPPHAPKQVARWALAQGNEQTPESGAQRRRVEVDPKLMPTGRREKHLWLGTASIETPAGIARVLLGTEAPHAVFGRRLWSRPRLLSAALASLLLLAVPVALLALQAAPTKGGARAAAAHAPASAAPPEAPALTPASAARPVLADVRPDEVVLPQSRPSIDESAKQAAREAVTAARAERSAAAPPNQGVAWALATPRLRTQVESELMLPVLKAAAEPGDPRHGLRFEVLPAGDDYRAVCWPFARRQDAEKLRDQLVARGHRIEVIEF